ncbi:MAG: hypothetical protein WC879_18650 [Melioribacteraceae bacterium]
MKKILIILFGVFLLNVVLLSQQSSKNPKYEIMFDEMDGNQYLADVYLPDYTRENGEKVLQIFIDKKKDKNVGGLHINFWNKRFSKAQMKSYNNDKFTPPKKTKVFLANYGYRKGYKEIQNIYEY